VRRREIASHRDRQHGLSVQGILEEVEEVIQVSIQIHHLIQMIQIQCVIPIHYLTYLKLMIHLQSKLLQLIHLQLLLNQPLPPPSLKIHHPSRQAARREREHQDPDYALRRGPIRGGTLNCTRILSFKLPTCRNHRLR
jgi:hypothetical protein